DTTAVLVTALRAAADRPRRLPARPLTRTTRVSRPCTDWITVSHRPVLRLHLSHRPAKQRRPNDQTDRLRVCELTQTRSIYRLRNRPWLHEPVARLRHAAGAGGSRGRSPESARSRLHPRRHRRPVRFWRERDAHRADAETTTRRVRPRVQRRHVQECAGPA